MEKKEEKAAAQAFQYESTIWNLGMANRRMLIALVTVCITFVITIVVFVNGYTEREKNWLDALSSMRTCAVEQDTSQARTGP